MRSKKIECLLLLARIVGALAPSLAFSPHLAFSDDEGDQLWQQGARAVEQGDCAAAVSPLRRFVDRYPGHASYIRAHFLLGRCELEDGQTADAIRDLRYFTEGAGAERAPDYVAAKTLLTRALLKIGDARAALLSATELAGSVADLPSPAPAEALVLQAEARAAQEKPEQDASARRDLDSARKLLAPLPPREPLVSEAAWLDLELNEHACARYPSREPMDEAQARSQLDRRGDCEMTGLVLFHDLAALKNEMWMDRAAREILASYENYSKACLNPPAPPKHSRTAVQLRRYRDELRAALADDCAHKFQAARDLLARWRQEPSLGSGNAPVDRLDTGLQNQTQILVKSKTGNS